MPSSKPQLKNPTSLQETFLSYYSQPQNSTNNTFVEEGIVFLETEILENIQDKLN